MAKLTTDNTVNALIMDNIAGEMYGENWEEYKMHIDSMPPMSDEEYNDMKNSCPF